VDAGEEWVEEDGDWEKESTTDTKTMEDGSYECSFSFLVDPDAQNEFNEYRRAYDFLDNVYRVLEP